MVSEDQLLEMKSRLSSLLKVKISDREILAIQTNSRFHSQPSLNIKVGGYYSDLEPGAPLEQVIAIFESPIFIVCTPNRGGTGGMPYLFLRQDVKKVELFNPGA